MKTFKQYIIEAKEKMGLYDNSIFVISPNKELKIVHPEGYPHEMGLGTYNQHDDHFPEFNFNMNVADTHPNDANLPRPLSFGRIDHASKQFYIITQAKGQPEGKERYGRPDYTLMRRKDVEQDVFDRLHTAKAIHEKHPEYRINVSSNPEVVYSLPEYEKFLMSHLG
jgi:hypothetical protein